MIGGRSAAVRWLLTLLLASCAAACVAQGTALPSEQERQRRMAEQSHGDTGQAMVEAPVAGAGGSIAPQTQQAYEASLRAYYAYREKGYQQRLQAFEWQGWSSKAIFVVVLLLVLSGIVFAGLQFGAGLGKRGKGAEVSTEFVVDMKGIQVRSPVLGVVVLAISLAFFYLYLVYVYPIVSVF